MAISFYIKALQIDPKHGDSFFCMGHCQSKLGLHEEAIKSYKCTIKIDLDNSEAYFNLGSSQGQLGLHEEAIKSYKRAIEVDPNHPDAYYSLGVLQRELGLLEDAIKINKRAIEVDPNYSRAYFHLAVMQAILNVFDSSLKNLEKYLLLVDLSLPANQDYIENAKKLISDLKQIVKFKIGDRDGSSFEKAIVVGSVGEEYAWMRNYCQGFEVQMQALHEIDDKAYDVHTLINDRGEERTVYFDISGFYHKEGEERVEQKGKKQSKWDKVATEAMKRLMDEGVPYHKGIEMLIGDCEFHYRMGKKKILSSTKEMILFLHSDIAIHSEALNLTYEIGKKIFNYWAITFHQKDFKKLMNKAAEIEGIILKSEDIVDELIGLTN